LTLNCCPASKEAGWAQTSLGNLADVELPAIEGYRSVRCLTLYEQEHMIQRPPS
jgi:hypothetical protein